MSTATMAKMEIESVINHTPLDSLHHKLGARMVPFAGYDMPIQYPTGIVTEHHHTRTSVGLFDVSHMGVVSIFGEQATAALERLIPVDLAELMPGQMKYGVFMLDTGGVLDDLLITRQETGYLLVINASRKQEDLSYLREHLGTEVDIQPWDNPVMIALQGPKAALVLNQLYPGVSTMPFMSGGAYGDAWISRSGYTGEDGYEVILSAEDGILLVEQLLAESEVAPIGLGARDSLRLEAGLCLYGHELTEDTTPIEAGLTWSIGKRRREEGGFLGAKLVLAQLKNGSVRKRVGLTLEPGSIAREGADIFSSEGIKIGFVSSGGHSPTLGHPIAIGYVETAFSLPGTIVYAQVRGQGRPATITKMPFVPHKYYKG